MATKTLYDRSMESSGLRLKLTWAVTSQNMLNDPPKMVHRSTEILNVLGAVSVEIKKGTSPTTDVTAEINGSTITIYVDEEASTGSYTATLTDSGRTSGNTATIIITVTA